MRPDRSPRRDRSPRPSPLARSLTRSRFALAPVLIASFALLLLTAPAHAAVSHLFISRFDGSGTPAKTFGTELRGLAVDTSKGVSAGDVYVADEEHHVVDRFAPAPESGFLCQVTGAAGSLTAPLSECAFEDTSRPGTPTGAFGGLVGIAVDPAAGDLYVADVAAGAVDRFTAAGAFVEPVALPAQPTSVAVSTATGDVYITVVGAETAVKRYDPVTHALEAFAPATTFGSPEAVAVDNSSGASAGDVYVLESGHVDHFNSTGELLSEVAGTPKGPFEEAKRLAVDPANGHLYVADLPAGVVDEFDAAGTFVAQIVGRQTPAGSITPLDLAVSATGDLYVTDLAHGIVDVLGPDVVVPEVTTGEAQELHPISALLTGSVNPSGVQLTKCEFEYVDEADYQPSAENPYAAGGTAPCVPAAGEIAADALSHPVEAHVPGLLPGVTYHFRLVAANAVDQAQPQPGNDASFSTPPVPSITGESVRELTDAKARLVANVNPHGVQLEDCHFEYGTDTSYGNVAPCTPAAGAIPPDSAPHLVSDSISPLKANTPYHWRISATSANGTNLSPDQTFIFDTSGVSLADARAYEMVTPAHKNGTLFGDLAIFGLPASVSEGGSRMIASTVQCFGNAESCAGARTRVGSPYELARNAGGWLASPLAPSAKQLEANTLQSYEVDRGIVLFSAPTAPQGEDHFYARQSNGSFLDIGPLTEPAKGPLGGQPAGEIYGTDGLSRLVWASQPQWPSLDATKGKGTLYEYLGSGRSQPLLVGVSGGAPSTDLISVCGTEAAASVPTGAFSEDGETMYFLAEKCEEGGSDVPADTLYARIDNGEPGARTVAISEPVGAANCKEPECLANTGAGHGLQFRGAQFYGASADGSRAVFASPQQLMDSATQDPNANDSARGRGCALATGANGCNLYEYDAKNAPGSELIDISAGPASVGGPRVQGVMAISPDASHVYFVARGALTPGLNAQHQAAQNGADNLYSFERDPTHPAGQITFIATLPASDETEWEATGNPANVTPDGRYLLFTSHGGLTADDGGASAAAQVFRYDSQTGALIRISIGNNGFNDNGNRTEATPCSGTGTGTFCAEDATIVAPALHRSRRTDPSMSHDGSYVFFQSPVGLTPGALDAVPIGTSETGLPEYAENVYEWHEEHVSLISDGRDITRNHGQSTVCPARVSYSSVCLLGVDATGSNVFFSTADPLVSADTDTELDYYDARICTPGDPCVKYPPPPPVCVADECHGAPAPPPPPPAPASAAFNGPGNLTPPPPAPVKPKTAEQIRVEKLTKALKACRKKRPGHKRAVCERAARKKYAKAAKASKRKN